MIIRHLCYLCSMTMGLSKGMLWTAHFSLGMIGFETNVRYLPSAVSFVDNGLEYARDAVTFTKFLRDVLGFLSQPRVDKPVLLSNQ